MRYGFLLEAKLSIRKMRVLFFLAIFSILSLLDSSQLAFAEIIDRIVASIDGDPVTEEEIREIVDQVLSLNSNTLSKADTENPKKLNPELIKEALVVLLFEKEASKMGVSISGQELEAYIQQVEQANNAQPGTLKSTLEEQGIPLDSYLAKIRSEMLRSKVLSAELRSKIQVSDEEVDEFIGTTKNNNEEVSDTNEFSLIKVSLISNSAEESNLNPVRDKIKEEKSCSGLSSMGVLCENLGIVSIENLKSHLQDALEGRSEFEPSEIVKEGESFEFYFKAPRNFSRENSAVKEEVRQRLFQEKFQVAAEKYLKEGLFNKYSIEIHDE
jgi:hypothetical protein